MGHLAVNVIQAEGLRAADIGGKSDPFVVLELINARVWVSNVIPRSKLNATNCFILEFLDPH